MALWNFFGACIKYSALVARRNNLEANREVVKNGISVGGMASNEPISGGALERREVALIENQPPPSDRKCASCVGNLWRGGNSAAYHQCSLSLL